MAINKNGAYVKVEGIMGSKAEVRTVVSFTRDNQREAEKEYFFVPDMDGANFIKQAYEYMKTLSEFVDAVDC